MVISVWVIFIVPPFFRKLVRSYVYSIVCVCLCLCLCPCTMQAELSTLSFHPRIQSTHRTQTSAHIQNKVQGFPKMGLAFVEKRTVRDSSLLPKKELLTSACILFDFSFVRNVLICRDMTGFGQPPKLTFFFRRV